MKQILQHFRTGRIELADIPCPMVKPRHLLIQSTVSLISPGTERMLVEFGQAGLIGKARAQPERVRQVLAKIRTDGIVPALEAVKSRLDEPFPLGYANVGRVVEVGSDVDGFAVGDRVVSSGPHAEVVCVPATMAARVPDGVDDEAASFAVGGAIALNGIRLIAPELGESVVVVGLGLLGILAAQLLRAHGCRVLGVDVNAARCELARRSECDAVVADGNDAVRSARAFSRDRGVDAVLITASAKTDGIVRAAAQMSRKRGRIVLVGVVGLGLQRSDFYEKELSFQVACSTGPGRYDPNYDKSGRDYPLPFVRWTAGRNLEAVLHALDDGRLDVRRLVSRRIPQGEAASAYDTILNDSNALGVVLTYPSEAAPLTRVIPLQPPVRATASGATRPVVGVIGAGNFSRRVLLPAIQSAGAVVQSIASAGGLTSLHAGRTFAANEATSDYREILASAAIHAVFIATRHDSHPRLVADALAAGKHVFVEKPLAIDDAGLAIVREAYSSHRPCQLLVGFNRRFAPLARRARQALADRSAPIAISMMINAGALPPEHWTRDGTEGGGRLLGEACHFVDLALFLVGRPIVRVFAAPLSGEVNNDSASISLSFGDGSIATIHYWTNGAQSYPKERVEVFSEGRVLTIDNWRSLWAHGWPGAGRVRGWRQDKGHRAAVAAFVQRVRSGGPPLVPFDELEAVTVATLAVAQSIRSRDAITIHRPLATEGNVSTVA